MSDSISVIIPSRLACGQLDPPLYLERAIASVAAQTCPAHEVIVGVDPNASIPIRDWPLRITWAHSNKPESQAAAVNCAANLATGTFLAFLEDDDTWHPKKLEYQIDAFRTGRWDFITCNQFEREQFTLKDPLGDPRGINDWATPSGWFMETALWHELGGFNEAYEMHLDNEFLGRVNENRCRRLHLVESGSQPGEWLLHVMQFSAAKRTEEAEPLVTRIHNYGGRLASAQYLPERGKRSQLEYKQLTERFGLIPW